ALPHHRNGSRQNAKSAHPNGRMGARRVAPVARPCDSKTTAGVTVTRHRGPVRHTGRLLPLAVLPSLTRLLEAVLLTFLLARIARQEACLLQCRTVVTIDLGERTCDRHLQCTSLTAGAATIQSADNVERILLFRSHQRVADQLLMQLVGEVVL